MKQLPLESRWSRTPVGEEEKAQAGLGKAAGSSREGGICQRGARLEGQGKPAKIQHCSSGLWCRSLALQGNFSHFCPPVASSIGFPPLQAPPSTQLYPIWEKIALWGWRGCTFGKHPASASIPLQSKPPPRSCQPQGWGFGFQEGHPGAPRPPCCPSVPPQAISGRRPDLPASAALITPLAPGAGALRPNYHRSFAPAQSMPLTEALERQIRAPRPGKAAAASGGMGMPPLGARWGKHRDALTWCFPSPHP